MNINYQSVSHNLKEDLQYFKKLFAYIYIIMIFRVQKITYFHRHQASRLKCYAEIILFYVTYYTLWS